MSDAERASNLLGCLSSNYHLDATNGSFTRFDNDCEKILAAFAAIRQEERERCARVAEREGSPGEEIRKATAIQIAASIREATP